MSFWQRLSNSTTNSSTHDRLKCSEITIGPTAEITNWHFETFIQMESILKEMSTDDFPDKSYYCTE